jgi:hypothetical protein
VANFCEHCQGQRFDRARVLRALRRLRTDLGRAPSGRHAEQALSVALHAIRHLELPHLEYDDEDVDTGVVH